MALGTRNQGAASGPSTPPRLTEDGGLSSPTALNSPVRYPPHIVLSGIAAGGTATVPLPPVPSGELWELELVRVASDSVLAAVASLYVGAVDLNGILAQTTLGNFNVLEGTPPWRIPSGAQLFVVFTNATPGANVHLRAQYRIITSS